MNVERCLKERPRLLDVVSYWHQKTIAQTVVLGE